MKKRVVIFSAIVAQGIVFAQESGAAFENKGERRQELGASQLAPQKGTGALAQKATGRALSSAGKISDPVGKSASALDSYSASLARPMSKESLVSGLLSVADKEASTDVSKKFATLRVSEKGLFGHKSEIEKLMKGQPDIAKNLERPLAFAEKPAALPLGPEHRRMMSIEQIKNRRDRVQVIAQAQEARKERAAHEGVKAPAARSAKR